MGPGGNWRALWGEGWVVAWQAGVPQGVGASHDGAQVKPEAVHVHLHHPVAQRVQHKLAHDRVVAVQRVAAARVVVVLPLGRQHVIHPVVQPPAL